MEAIGEDLGKADDAGSWLRRPAYLHVVPGQEPSQPSVSGSGQQDVLDGLASQLAAAVLAAPAMLGSTTHVDAANYAARIEGLSRSVEYLQLVAAGAVDRTRTQAIHDAAAAGTRAGGSRGWITGWDANGIGTLNSAPLAVTETDANRPDVPAQPGREVVTSPAEDGCRNTGEFLRLRLRIPIREARRRLTLANSLLPGTSLSGEPTPSTRPHVAAALTPTTAAGPDGKVQGPALSSHAATIITTTTLDRLQHHTTPDTLDRIEHHLTEAATTADPAFLSRLA